MGHSRSNHNTAQKSPSKSSTKRTVSTSSHEAFERHCPPQRTRSGGGVVRQSPRRTKSDNANLRRPSEMQDRRRTPRGRSFSPSGMTGRRDKPPKLPPRGRSQSPFSNAPRPRERSRSNDRHGDERGPSEIRSRHIKRTPAKRSNHNTGPPMRRIAQGRGRGNGRNRYPPDNRSLHSRSGHTTIFNSHHSRSAHSITSRSGHGRSSSGSRSSLVDQHMGRNRLGRIHRSPGKSTKSQFPWTKFCLYLLPVIVLIAAAIGLLMATRKKQDSSLEHPPENESVAGATIDEDPFDGGKSPPQWTAGSSGLEIKIINALDETWSEVVGLVIKDWDDGNPDAITIFVEKVAADSVCAPMEGVIKICSGDYGDSKWRGQTEFLLDGGGNIAAASVKMNTFYLRSMNTKARQYTLCHEIGHALGLSHLDEDFTNVDLGSCMEYTNDISVNRRPNQSNYEMLLELYGGIRGELNATVHDE
ncbi:hypothetical protein IV203_026139 [Nitzschia inconspicua]|uniref:Uncharacterized protein n=1 Tax=Nitzschia inconspicua TaxID=303405 RepID=A0A9K3LI05_9STRA|nr:hypothetical protein IV203_026139 [Nitzschia inconspicua]